MDDLRGIIQEIQVTEKGTFLAGKGNQYLLRVHPAANKIEIRQAVEKMFKVKVERVNTMNYRGKKKRERTSQYGQRSDWKRAVVRLKEGDKIDLA